MGLKSSSCSGALSWPLADEEKAVGRAPRLGLPAGLEIAKHAVQLTPSSSALDHPFELKETLEGNREGELDSRSMQSLGDGFVEKRAVDTGLHSDLRQRRMHALQTLPDEGIGPIGVVDIAGSVVNIEHLVGLCDGTKQRVVAARAFLFLVETHRRAFGVASRAQHGTVEVERHSRQPLGQQAFQDQVLRFTPDFLDTERIGAPE